MKKKIKVQEGTNFMLNYTDIIILNYTTLFVNHLFFQANIIIRMKSNNNSKKMNVVKTMFKENRIWVIYGEI